LAEARSENGFLGASRIKKLGGRRFGREKEKPNVNSISSQ